MPSGSSLTKFAAVTKQSRVCVSGSGEGGGSEGQSGRFCRRETAFSKFANASKRVPVCGAPSRDQAVLFEGFLGGRT